MSNTVLRAICFHGIRSQFIVVSDQISEAIAQLVFYSGMPIPEKDQRFVFTAEWDAPDVIRKIINHIHRV
jgi:hypothetical protein